MQCFHIDNPLFGSQTRLRTQCSGVQEERGGKWSVTFETFRGTPGRETRVTLVTSAALFDSENLAWCAANRALDTLENTGSFPNLEGLF